MLISGTSATRILQGVTRGTALFINQSSDVILIGQNGDTLSIDGVSLQPLASISVDATFEWWGRSQNLAGSEIDVVTGAEAWSPSPAQIASQISSSTLAAAINSALTSGTLSNLISQAIYTQGTRLVDNASTVLVPNLASFGPGTLYGLNAAGTFILNTFPLIDVSNYQSIITQWSCTVQCTIRFDWLDSFGDNIFSRTYELAPNDVVYIASPHYGPFVQIQANNLNGVTTGALNGSVRFSNRVLPGETVEVHEDQVLYVNEFVSVAAAGVTSTFTIGPTAERIGLSIAAVNGKGQFRYYNGFAGSTHLRALDLVANSNQYFEIASSRRPLYANFRNTDAVTATYNITAVQVT